MLNLKIPFWLIAFSFFNTLLANEADEKVILKGDTTIKLGGTVEKGDWSYSFINLNNKSRPTLVNQYNGRIYFEDEDWLIAVQESASLNSNSKSEITFYKNKDLKTKTVVRVPNCIEKIGRIPGSDFFYFLTKKLGKYNYDDAPLALILIDPLNNQLERIKIVEGDHWLANDPIAIIPGKLKLTIKLLTSRYDEYIKSPLQNKHFSDIKLEFTKSPEIQPEFSFYDDVNSEKYAGIKRKSLLYLDSTQKYLSNTNKYPREYRINGLNTSRKNSNAEIMLARPLNNGELQAINISELSSNNFKVQTNEIAKLGFFDSGLLYILDKESIMFISNNSRDDIKKINLSNNSKVYFDNNFAYITNFSIDESTDAEGNPNEFFGFNSSEWDLVSQNGNIQRKKLDPPIPLKYLSKSDDFSIFPNQNILIKNSRPRFQILPDDGTKVFNAISGEGGDNIFSVISLIDGSVLAKEIKSETYFYAPTSNSKFDVSEDNWVALSFLSAWYGVNGNQKYGVFIQHHGNEDFFTISDSLSNLPSLLKCINHKDGNVMVLFSEPGKTNLIAFSPSQKKIVSQKQWQSPTASGDPHFLAESNLLFVPRAYGYDAFDLEDSVNPKLGFSLHLGATGSYAVVLPSGLFAGSPGCEDLINLPAGEGMVDSSAVLPWRNRPAEVLKAIGGDPEQIEVLSKVTERWLRKLGNPEKNPEPTAADIPSLTLANDVPLWAESDEVLLKFEAKPGTAPVKEVIVRVNGVDQQRGENTVANQSSIERTIKLAEGQNWIEAVAIDEKGRSSNLVRFRAILSDVPKSPKRYIIAVGVSKYKNTDLNLEFAAKDATDLAAAIKESTKGETEVLLLTNDQATKDAPAKIREFLANASENDEVVAFCAGHGVLDSNLDYVYASHEFDSANPSETGIKLDELVDAIGSSKSLKRLLLLDTCHSGQVGEKDEMLLAQMDTELPKGVRAVKQRGMSVKPAAGLSAEGQQRFIEEMFLLPGLHRGINIIGASGGAEFALESAQWNNGVFTAAIIEALREKKADWNEDGRVSVGELRNYLAQRVSELTKGAQKPSVVAAERDQEFDLIRASYKRQSEPSVSEPASIQISSELPPENTLDLESRIRSYYQAIQGRNEAAVGTYFADQVDYYSSGTIPKSKVMADVRGDWKRYSNSTFSVSNFESLSPTSCQFILDYSLMQGDRPRRGKLQMNATLTSNQPQKIQSIKAKVLSAK